MNSETTTSLLLLTLILLLQLVQPIEHSSSKLYSNNKSCSGSPNLKILTSVHTLLANNVTINEQTNEIFVPGRIKLGLECSSRFPVDLDIDGHLMNQEINVESIRETENNSKSSCFRISVEILTTRESTGNYTCRNVPDGKSASLYIFGDGEHPPYLLHGDIGQDTMKVETSPGDKIAIIPCVSTNPNVSVALYKVEFEDFHLITYGPHLTYDPKVGFSLHLTKFPDPYGRYKCVARKSDLFDVFVEVLEPIDQSNLILPNSISPVSLDPDEYQGRHSFVCTSSDDVSLMSSLNCRNPIECNVAEKCFLRDVTCKDFQSCRCLRKGFSCSKSFKAQKNITGESCSIIPSNTNGGVVLCSSLNKTRNNSPDKIIKYFKGLRGKIVTDWKTAETREILYVASVFNQTETVFYVGEEIKFICIGSPFVFSKEFRWLFKLNNGAYIVPNITSINFSTGTNSDAFIREEAKIVITDPDIVQVICAAPLWNDSQYINATETLIVKDSIAPNFLDATNETLTISANDVNQTLYCAAIGFPQPDLLWLRNGEEFLTDFHFDNSRENITKSMIMLKNSNLVAEGGIVYTCNASNPRGMVFKTFTIDVYHEPTAMLVFTVSCLVVAFCIVFLMLLFYTMWKKYWSQKKGYIFHIPLDVDEFENGNPEAVKKCSDECEKALYLPYDKNLEIKPEHLITDYNNILGQGEFGVVLKGKLVCKSDPVSVAVKTIKGSNANHLKILLSELKIRMYIGNHENVVNLLGAVTKTIAERSVSVVFEYCQLGSMEKYLRSHRNTFLNEFAPDGSRLCTHPPSGNYVKIEYLVKTSDLILWAYQIAQGMEYLSNKKVIHGDLAARNILLTENHVVKITDFGLSKHLYNYTKNYIMNKNDVPMPWRWLSLEALRDQSFSVHSDVWAYGVTLWELFSLAEIPYPGVNFNEDFINNLLEGQRLGKPKYSNYEIYRIMKECWRLEVKERPSFSALKYSFQYLLPSNQSQTESETESEDCSEDFSAERRFETNNKASCYHQQQLI